MKKNLLLPAFLLVSVLGCEPESLVPLDSYVLNRQGYATVEADFCMQPGSLYRQKLKYIFVVDKSSSNQNPPDATDPSGNRRYGPLSSFVQDSSDDPGYTYYSLVNFSTSASIEQDFTDNRLAFRNVVDGQWNENGPHRPADLGYTDYLSALDSVQRLISEDAKLSLNGGTGPILSSSYVVVFVSDGAPVVPFDGDISGVMTQTTSSIEAKIAIIMGLKSDPKLKGAIDSITIHTGYYFQTADAGAESLLSDMAAKGNGNAYTFGAGVDIDYTLFAVPVRKVRHFFTDLSVENKNAVWWDDGRYLRDSDGDGLPDEIENQFGANAFAADSDGNGVSDLVEYRIKGKPCKDAQCSHDVTRRDNYALCTGLMNGSPIPDGVNPSPYGTYIFPDGDKDGLNDCEELILGSVPDQFDSNADGLLDFMSLKNHMPFIQGVNFTNTDSDGDGVQNYAEIKMGAPLWVANRRLVNFKKMSYDILRIDSQNGTDCFHARVENVAIVGPDSLIRLNLTENTAVIDNRKTLRVAEGRLAGLGDFIQFSDGDFK